MRALARWPLLLLAAAGGPGCKTKSSSPPPADLIVVGGRIRTLDDDRPIAEALAITQGVVAAVGPRSTIEARRGPETRVLDIEGAVAVPGLVDAHLHLESVGAQSEQLDLRDLSLGEIEDRVRQAAGRRPPGTPIVGRGWDQTGWRRDGCSVPPCLDDESFPTRGVLDAAAPEHPVILTRVDGHAAWVNGLALTLAGIDASTSDPSGGRIVRDRDGAATGVLIDNAMDIVKGGLPDPDRRAIRRRLLAAQAHLLSLGLVAVHDMGTSPEVLAELRQLDAERALKLKVLSYLWGQDASPLEPLLDLAEPREGRRLWVVGVKLMADGALGSRGAALLSPYTDADHAGDLLLAEAELERRLTAIRAHRLAPAVHAIGDRANRLVLDLFERLALRRAAEGPPRVEHAQILHPADLPRFARVGAVASMQPTHATSDMRWAADRLGAERLTGAYAWRSLRVSGATLALGSDAPVESADPLAGLFAARTRTTPSGSPAGGWRPGERLSAEVALRGFTVGTWQAVGMTGGRLAPGAPADLTVLSVDPVADPAEGLLDATVRATVVDGEVVFEATSESEAAAE